MALQRSATFLFLAWPCFAFAASNWECISDYATSKQNLADAEVNCNEGKDVVHAESEDRDLRRRTQFEKPDHFHGLAVQCSEDSFEITLPAGPLSGVKILGSKKTHYVLEAPESCGYSLRRGDKRNILIVRFSGCLVSFQDGQHILKVSYVNEAGLLAISEVSCADYSDNLVPSDVHPKPRAPPSSKLSHPHPLTQNRTTSPVGWEGMSEGDSKYHDFDDISEEVTFKHHHLDELSVEDSFKRHHLDVEEHDYRDGKAVVQLAEVSVVQSELEAVPEVTNVSVTNAAPVSLVVLCNEDEFKVMLPAGPLGEVKILGSNNNTLPVLEAPESCGYSLSQGENYNSLTVHFSGCLVRRQGNLVQDKSKPTCDYGVIEFEWIDLYFPTLTLQAGRLQLRVSYVNESGIVTVSNLSCEPRPKLPVSTEPLDPPDVLEPRARPASKLQSPYAVPRPQKPLSSSGCSIPRSQQVPCGYRYSRISSSRCLAMGCCVDSATSACFYPMDECTADKHFVFIIPHDIAAFPVDPANLMVVGKSNCGPVIVSNKFAVFKFSVTRCGTHSYEIGGTIIYTAELQTAVRTLNLKYGVISRDNLLRVMVECRYPIDELGSWPAVVRLGYMVKSPSFSSHSRVRSQGQFGVQLRIAQDGRYDTYLEQYHQPLQVLLGKPVYLEVRLMSPRPEATLLVNYCLAYPRSATKALVLIHEGCANPLDPNISILKFHNLRQNRHRRRFMVQAFQFMDQRSNKYLTEEIYFMCSTEVCMPTERTCKQRCFDGKV